MAALSEVSGGYFHGRRSRHLRPLSMEKMTISANSRARSLVISVPRGPQDGWPVVLERPDGGPGPGDADVGDRQQLRPLLPQKTSGDLGPPLVLLALVGIRITGWRTP
jgi:hypothetical protein